MNIVGLYYFNTCNPHYTIITHLLTLAGYRKSFTNPKSSPVAKTVPSLVRHEAVTSVTSPIIGQMPSQQEPKTLVHDAQEIFSACKNSLFEIPPHTYISVLKINTTVLEAHYYV